MFDEFATAFVCPGCLGFCNCTQCSRARGEAYIPERNGGWRRWGPQKRNPLRDADAVSGFVKSAESKRRDRGGTSAPGLASQSPLDVVECVETQNATTAVLTTLSGEPRDNATMLTRTVPTQLSTPPPSVPASASATAMSAAADTSPHTVSSPQHKGRRRYVYIGKRLKAWGRLVSVPDPEEARQQQRKNTRQLKRKRAGGRGRGHLFAGSEEPLLLARKRRRAAKKRSKRRQDFPSSSSSFSASLLPGLSSPARAAGGDVNEGVWPGEFPMPLPASVVAAGGEVGGYGDRNLGAVLRITPEEVERAIGAAFAVGSP
jgi:hypothetical protein